MDQPVFETKVTSAAVMSLGCLVGMEGWSKQKVQSTGRIDAGGQFS
jgi:hypothetical protein